MKRAVLAAALCLCLPARALAIGDSRLAWERRDTKLHIAAAFGSSLAATELFEWLDVPPWKATLISSLLVLSAGVFKECVRDAAPSGSDLMADGVGVAANAGLQFTIRFGGPKQPAKARRPAQ